MSLDIYFRDPTATYGGNLHEQNITHNLVEMADDLGIYGILWHPEENSIKTADQLIEPLENAIKMMKANPDQYKKFDAPNGWGIYDDFLPWLKDLLVACKTYPKALIEVSR